MRKSVLAEVLLIVAVFCFSVFFRCDIAGASEQFSVQVGNYSSLEDALRALDTLKDNRIYCDIEEGGTSFTVRCGPFSSKRESIELRDRALALGYQDAFLLSSGPMEKEPLRGEAEEAERPIGREKKTADVFETRGGYLHPFLSVAEYYTDNTFNTKDDKKSDSYTVVSPGIWLLVPRAREYAVEMDTGNTTPGGLKASRNIPRYPGQFQTYFVYRANIERHNSFSSENTTSHLAGGAVQYNFRGGLSIDLADQFVKSHEARGSGEFFTLDKFTTNLINVIANFETNTKWHFRVDYSNFRVSYKEARNDLRDRVDNSFSAYVFYMILPKTTVFTEYELVGLNYNTDFSSDGREHHLFGGVQWDIAAKSKGSVKAGYGVKEFSAPALEKSKNFLLEAQVDHKFTPKTSLKLLMSRRTNESDIAQLRFVVSDSIGAEYLQKITPKITASANLSYSMDRYAGELTFSGETKRLEDINYSAGVTLQYEFNRWLKSAVGYTYTRRDSSFSAFAYTNNSVYVKVSGTL